MTQKNKKGIETVVAWVLLLGFSITLAVFVFNWSIKGTEEMTEGTIRFAQGGIQCGQVQIYAIFEEGATTCHSDISITNRGYLTIEKITVRGINKDTKEPITNQEINTPLKPKESIEGLTAGWDIPDHATLELIPVIKEGKELIGCTDRSVSVEC